MDNITAYVESQDKKSKAQIAKEIGVSRPFLYQLLSQERYPSLDVALRIAKNTGGKVPVSSWPNLKKISTALGGAA